MSNIGHDIRYAARSLRRSPGFTAAVVATLALGIGANAAVFSVVRHVLLDGLPYPEAGRIVTLSGLNATDAAVAISGPDVADWRTRSHSVTDVAAYPNPAFMGETTVLGGSSAARTAAIPVTRNFFAALATPAAHGRVFAQSEFTSGAARVAVVSDRFWRNQLSGRPIDGQRLTIYGEAFTVVGVMPPGFQYPARADIWFPNREDLAGLSRTAGNFSVIGRLGPGASVESAQREMNAVSAALKQQYGSEERLAGVRVTGLRESLVGSTRLPLLLLWGASAVLLILACTNIASSVLARGAGRTRELGVRTALGAGRGRIVQQLLLESVLLGAAGGLAALFTASLGVNTARAVAGGMVPRIESVVVDGWTLGVIGLLAVVSALGFGLLPAIRLSRHALAAALRSGDRGSAGSVHRRTWSALIGAQVAMVIVLLVGASLLLKSFAGVVDTDGGFRAERVLTITAAVPASKYPDTAAVVRLYAQALQQLRAIPGVRAAGLVNILPLAGRNLSGDVTIDGNSGPPQTTDYRVAADGFFGSLGIPLLAGRLFTPDDRDGAPDVAVVSESFARRVWPGESAIGKTIRSLANDSWVYGARPVTVVGVVGDVRNADLTRPPNPTVYVSFRQRPARVVDEAVFTVAASSPLDVIAPAVRERLRGLEAEMPIEMAPLAHQVAESVAPRRFPAVILGTFAGLALLLALVGVFGVVAYAASQRTREVGIRLALGGTPRGVRWAVMKSGVLAAAAGLAVGVAAALAASRVLASILYGISAADPITYVEVAVGVAAAVGLASYLPVLKATRVDPMEALRNE